MDFENKLHHKKNSEANSEANIEKTERLDKEPAALVVNVFRHGQAKYSQQRVELGESEDLTPEGEAEVKKQAEILAESVDPEEEVTVWASPYGRTLKTAKIIVDALREKELNLRKVKKEKGEEYDNLIRPFDVFEEVRGFDQKLFTVFVNGGTLERNGTKIDFKKEQLNPEKLDWVEYFNKRAWEEIDEQVKNQIPEEVLKAMDGIESEEQSNERLMRKLRTLAKIANKKKRRRIIIVTHQGTMSGLSDETVDTADFVEIKFDQQQ